MVLQLTNDELVHTYELAIEASERLRESKWYTDEQLDLIMELMCADCYELTGRVPKHNDIPPTE